MVLHSKNGYPEFCSKTSRITYLTFLLSEKIKQNYSPQGLETKPTALIIDVNLWKSIYESFPRFDAIYANYIHSFELWQSKKWSDQSKTYRPIRKSANFDKESSYFFFHYFSITNCLALRQRKNLSSSLWMKFGLQSGSATCYSRTTKSRQILDQIF